MHPSGKTVGGAGLQLRDKQPGRIDGSGHLYRAQRQDRMKAERAVVGRIADEDHQSVPGTPRGRKRLAYQGLAMAAIFLIRIDNEWPEKQRANIGDDDFRQPHRTDQPVIELNNK